MRYRAITNILSMVLLSLLVGTCPAAGTLRTQIDPQYFTWEMPAANATSIWHTMSDNFHFTSDFQQTAVIKEIRYYMHHLDYVYQLTQNANPYIYYIYQQTQQRGLPAELALLPMIESEYKPFVHSNRGAAGLWQMMPETASDLGIKINWWYDGRRSVIKSTKAALDHLTYLHSCFKNWLLAIAAYDSGEGTVHAAIEHNLRMHLPTDFWSLHLPLETKVYVPKLLALAAIIEYARHYHLIKIYPIPNKPFFKAVNMNHQLDLHSIASISHTNIHTVIALNPALRRGVTDPKDTKAVLLPVKKAATFQAHLQESHPQYVGSWEHHRTTNGESLSGIARHYHTSVNVIKHVNSLKSNSIHKGEELIIPKLVPAAHKQQHELQNKPHPELQKKQQNMAQQHPKLQHEQNTTPQHPKLLHVHQIAAEHKPHVKPQHTERNVSKHHPQHAQQYARKAAQKKSLSHNSRSHIQENIRHYTVKPGDSISALADRFDLTPLRILRFNHLRHSLIHPGEHLKIPQHLTMVS